MVIEYYVVSNVNTMGWEQQAMRRTKERGKCRPGRLDILYFVPFFSGIDPREYTTESGPKKLFVTYMADVNSVHLYSFHPNGVVIHSIV